MRELAEFTIVAKPSIVAKLGACVKVQPARGQSEFRNVVTFLLGKQHAAQPLGALT